MTPARALKLAIESLETQARGLAFEATCYARYGEPAFKASWLRRDRLYEAIAELRRMLQQESSRKETKP